jgi:hypothetical protein
MLKGFEAKLKGLTAAMEVLQTLHDELTVETRAPVAATMVILHQEIELYQKLNDGGFDR